VAELETSPRKSDSPYHIVKEFDNTTLQSTLPNFKFKVTFKGKNGFILYIYF